MRPDERPREAGGVFIDDIGRAAFRRNPKLEPFLPFIGIWRTIGSHPMMEGQRLEGLASFSWHQGGAFVIMHSQMEQQEVPPAVAIFGSDDDGRLAMIYFDRRGVSRHYAVSFEDGAMHWRRDDVEISQRMTFTVGAEGKTIEQVGRISQQGGPWQDDLALTYNWLSAGAADEAGQAHPLGA